MVRKHHYVWCSLSSILYCRYGGNGGNQKPVCKVNVDKMYEITVHAILAKPHNT